MERIEKTIEVDMPLHEAYNRWTRFEDYAKFMEGVQDVRQLDDTHLIWRAQRGGKSEEWTSEIDEQVPDRRIAWHSTSGNENSGQVLFESQGPHRTRVTLVIGYVPKNAVGNMGDSVDQVGRRAEGDLKRFKEYAETREMPTREKRADTGKGKGQRQPEGKRGGQTKRTM